MPRVNKNLHFSKSSTEKRKDFVEFLFERGEVRLSPYEKRSDKKLRKMPLYGRFVLLLPP